MFLTEIEKAVLEMVRVRVRNGETTERALARSTGISQPHIHNVLKGARRVSPELIDEILRHMHLCVFDALDTDSVRRFLGRAESEGVCLPVLDGEVGPGCPWPVKVRSYTYMAVPRPAVAAMWQPVIVRAAHDARMSPVLNAGDMVVLDQSLHGRIQPETGRHYLVKRGNCGLIRQIRRTGKRVFLVAEDAIESPEAWEEIRMSRFDLSHFIRARVEFVAGWGDVQDFRAASR